MKKWIVKVIILMIGLTIAHLGVTLFLLSDLGAGTIVCVALVGPVAGIFMPINERIIKKIYSSVKVA
jgi:uncharacterized membrane protein YczE